MRQIKLEPGKTYKTEANAIKAVEEAYGKTDLRYMIVCNDAGRFYPLFIGQEALHYQVWFKGFCVVA